jgi:putative membrane protein
MTISLALVSIFAKAEVDVAIPDVARSIIEWPPHTIQGAMLSTALFALMGIVLAIFGFKLFDWLTPGDLQKEVFEKNNIAPAILGAAVILGICAIIAAAVHS